MNRRWQLLGLGAAAAATFATFATACTGDDVSPSAPLDAAGGDASVAAAGDAGVLLRVTQTNFVVDTLDAGNVAPLVDPNLVDPWGFALTPAGVAWVADNGPGMLTQYNAAGASSGPSISIPGPGGVGQGAPSGEIFNPMPDDFDGDELVLSTEDGTLAGWKTGGAAVLRLDESATGAVFKGLDVLDAPSGRVLLVANFNAGIVEVFDTSYAPVTLPGGSFVDLGLTPGFAPFNVMASGASVYIAYAKQDAMKRDDAAGPGNGLVDVFDETGAFVRRLVTGGALNSPWGLALAPADYSLLAGALLVGNFGNGAIDAYDPATGAPLGELATASGAPFSVEGLWGLRFGQDLQMESHTQLFFTAGTDGEVHGLFGRLDLAL